MFTSPMLLQKSNHPFDDDSYITELKIDGVRIIWTKFNDKIRIYTRHNNEVTSMFPELININLPNGTVLDGELVVSDDNGKPDFEATMIRFKSKKSLLKYQYCIFDVLQYKGDRLYSLPLLSRKKLLNNIVPEHPYITVVQWIEGNGISYFQLVKENELEGIVLKKAESLYEVGKRSFNWLKVINYQYDTVFLTGLRKEKFGVLLSFLDGRSAGLMEFIPNKDRQRLYSSYKFISENDEYKFFEPIKCRVKYRNLTKKGMLRIPSFVEWI